MIKTKLFVDDERYPVDFPIDDSWEIARSFHEAIYLLERNTYEVVSLDHDIQSFYGNREMTGRDILNWLIAQKLAGLYTPSTVIQHTQNAVGMQSMQADIERYWP